MMNSPPSADSNMPDPDRPEVSTSSLADGNLSDAATVTQSTLALQKRWVGGNTLGFAIVTVILFRMAVSANSVTDLMPGIQVLLWSEIVVGSGVGTLQALILKRQISRLRIWQWILVSMVGGYLGIVLWAITMLAVVSMSAFVPTFVPTSMVSMAILTVCLLGVMLGGSIALGQVLVLAPHVCGLRRWWWASVVGRSLGWLGGVLVGQPLNLHQELAPLGSNVGIAIIMLLFCGGIGGLVYGDVTAWALPSLTPRSQRPRSN